MRSRWISFHLRHFSAENIHNICRLSAFVKVPSVGIEGETWRYIQILSRGICNSSSPRTGPVGDAYNRLAGQACHAASPPRLSIWVLDHRGADTLVPRPSWIVRIS